jgi:adenylyl-sulfate kinase
MQSRPAHETASVAPADFPRAPVTIWLTGLPGSGKSTLANALRERLREMGHSAVVLDGDGLRLGLSRDLGFSRTDRAENVRRAAEVARLVNDAGHIAIAALIAPHAEDRARARDIIGADRYIEIYLSTDRATCEARDPKGLYLGARVGAVRALTGVDAPYEPPARPDRSLNTTCRDIADCLTEILATVTSVTAITGR